MPTPKHYELCSQIINHPARSTFFQSSLLKEKTLHSFTQQPAQREISRHLLQRSRIEKPSPPLPAPGFSCANTPYPAAAARPAAHSGPRLAPAPLGTAAAPSALTAGPAAQTEEPPLPRPAARAAPEPGPRLQHHDVTPPLRT